VKLSFVLESPSALSVAIFNLIGTKVREVTCSQFLQGENQLEIPTDDLPEGNYCLRVTFAGGVATQKLVVVR